MRGKRWAEVLEASEADLVGAVSVTDGQQAWMYHPGQKEVVTGEVGEIRVEGEPFLSPRQAIEFMDEAIQWVLDTHEAKLIGEESVDGVATYKLEFIPKKGEEIKLPFPMGGKVTLWVEKDRWILLQAHFDGAALGQGQMHVRSFELNAGVPDDRFQFEVPEGVQVINIEDMKPTPLTLDEAKAQADFSLLTPNYMPEGTTLVEVLSMEGAFVLRYDHSTISFTIIQRQASAEATTESHGGIFASREVTLRGQTATLITDEVRGNSLLAWAEDGVAIQVAGSISQEEILKVAESLR